VRPYSEPLLQVPDVLHHGQDLEPPIAQAKEDADPYIVDPRLHGPIQGGDPPVVVLLLPARVYGGIGLVVIGLLKELVCPDSGLFQFLELLHGQRGHIDVDPSDLSGAAVRGIDRLDRPEDIGEALLGIGLPCHQEDPLVALVNQYPNLPADLLLGQGAALDLRVAGTERTIQALISAEV
jgi:hypothetical protein